MRIPSEGGAGRHQHGIMEKKMETMEIKGFIQGYIGILEKKMETMVIIGVHIGVI